MHVLRNRLQLAGLWALVAVTIGCGSSSTVQEELSLQEQIFRRYPGSTGSIYAASKKALDRLGIQITGERENSLLCGKFDLARRPVFVSVKVSSGNRVYVQFYNLTATEEDEWRAKLYKEIDAVLGTTPAGREKVGRARQG